MSEADYYRSQAERCRQLIRVLDDPESGDRLRDLAKDFDRRAKSFAARERREHHLSAPPPVRRS